MLVAERAQIGAELPTFTQRVGQGAQMAHNLRRESLEQRQQLEAHLCAQEPSLTIRGILCKLERMAAQVQNDVHFSRSTLGTDPAAAAWR